ncbi:MAG: peptidylprolyl isomerase [Planctomycetes bacterium]|nr:peptidylprolyl isomerase [Planctomycetota bacterium]
MGAKPVSASIDAFVAWEKANPQFLENPAPSPAEKVRFVTDAGTFEVAFYPDAAPEHVKNFKQLAKDHFYEKTKFHRVTKGGTSIVQGGDPNTIDGPKEKWGQGSKGDGIPVEGNKLVHVRGAVAMAQPSTPTPDKKSSGCQFYIVTKGSHNLDGNYTVFGTVVSGMDVVDKIAAGEIEPGTDRPLTPVMVTKTEIF